MAVARIAKIKIREGANKEFETKFAELTKEVHEKEPAAIHHILHRSREAPNAYVIYEQYVDEDAMVAHGRTRHFNMLGIQVGLFIIAKAEVQVIDPV